MEWKVEAEWGPNGALCVGKDLRVDMFEDMGIAHTAPPCRDALQAVENCGTFPTTKRTVGTLGNHYCPKWQSDPDKCVLGD